MVLGTVRSSSINLLISHSQYVKLRGGYKARNDNTSFVIASGNISLNTSAINVSFRKQIASIQKASQKDRSKSRPKINNFIAASNNATTVLDRSTCVLPVDTSRLIKDRNLSGLR